MKKLRNFLSDAFTNKSSVPPEDDPIPSITQEEPTEQGTKSLILLGSGGSGKSKW